MKPIEKNKQKFTKLYDALMEISVQQINSTQKIFFSYILGWQEKGKTLTAKNIYIANKLGLTESGIRKAISTSKKFDFFSSNQLGNKKGENGYTSTHEIKIDVDKFEKYLKLNHSKTAFYENLNEPENEPDEVEEPNQPEEETTVDNKVSEEIKIDNSIQLETNSKKEKLREKYNSTFKYKRQGSKLTPAEFHGLTNDCFFDKLKMNDILTLTAKYNSESFDLFWSDIQKLKEKFKI